MSDIVTLHVNLRNNSRHLINLDRLKQMRSTSFLINTARGALVDEAAFITALKEGLIAGVALDIFEEEPLPASSPMRHLHNVYLTPHNANASFMVEERVHANSISNLLSVLNAAG